MASSLRRTACHLPAAGWAVALVAGLALGVSTPAQADEMPQQNCFVLCPTTPPPVQTLAPGPQPFTLPPVSNPPSLPPPSTQPAAPAPSSAAPSPSPSGTPAPIPTLIPSPPPTPITVGSDHPPTIPALEPTATGGGLDGGGVLIRLFLVLSLLAAGSVASLFALR